jgi:hypothetical protein
MREPPLMHAWSWVAAFWPGFAQAWCLGRVSGLALAAAFAGCFNSALVASYLWVQGDLANGQVAALAWLMVGGIWIVGLIWLKQDASLLGLSAAGHADPDAEAWFREAQHEYLKGHWLEAETLLGRIRATGRFDAAVELLLASVQRRSGRIAEAQRTLTEMKANPAAAIWLFEVESELASIAAEEQTSAEADQPILKAA